MSGYNKAIIMGNLGQDPELKYTGAGTPVCRLSVATTRNWTDKENNKHEETEWHRVTVWGRTAENCNQYLAKGRQVLVEGRLRTQKWDDKDGVTRYSTEIVADGVQFLATTGRHGDSDSSAGFSPSASSGFASPVSGPPDGGGKAHSRAANGQFKSSPCPTGPEDDDIPF